MSQTKRKRRIVAPPEEVRSWILAATSELLGELGYRGMTISAIARKAGVGKGTVYRHFESKEQLVLAHVDEIVERVLSAMASIASRDVPPDARLREMLIARVMLRFDAVASYRESLDELLRSVRSELLERRLLHFRREASLLEKVLREGSDECFSCTRPAESSRLLILSTNSLLPYNLDQSDLDDRQSVLRRVRGLSDLLLAGLRRR